MVRRDSKVDNFADSLFFLLIIVRSGLRAEIRLPVCISKSHRSLCVSFSRTGSGLCIYHLLAWSNLNFFHISQWIFFKVFKISATSYLATSLGDCQFLVCAIIESTVASSIFKKKIIFL